jgi:hypothetical protein
MTGAPTAALVLLLMPATNAARPDDAAKRCRPHMIEGIGRVSTGWLNANGGFRAVEAKLFDANRTGLRPPSLEVAAR